MASIDHHEGEAVALNPQSLTYGPIYRIKGVPDHDEATGWHYIGSLDGVARFSNGKGVAVHLELAQLVEVEPGRLAYTPPG